MKTLRAAVVGLGVGEQHLLSYRNIPGVGVAAVCDLDSKRLDEVARRYDVPNSFVDYRKITEDADIDVVSICSYDDCHAEQTISALENGKHVMVEKPVALSRADAEAILRAQQDSGRLLTSNLVLRKSPRFIELKRRITAGEFGEIVYMEGDYIHQILHKIVSGWRGKMAFYCVVYGGGIHLIDLMRWLVGHEVEEVCGMSNKILTRDTDYRFDDVFVNLLRFEGGALAKTLTTFGPQHPKMHALDIYGTRKSFVNDVPDGKIYDGDATENESRMTTPYPAVAKGAHIPGFIDAIRNGGQPEVGPVDIFRVMDVCFAAYDSVRAGRVQKVSYLL